MSKIVYGWHHLWMAPVLFVLEVGTYRVYDEGRQEGDSHPGSARHRHSADPHHGRKYLVGHLNCSRQGYGGEASPDHGECHPRCSLLTTVWESIIHSIKVHQLITAHHKWSRTSKPARNAQTSMEMAVPRLAVQEVNFRPRWWMHTTARMPAGNSKLPIRLELVKISKSSPRFRSTYAW